MTATAGLAAPERPEIVHAVCGALPSPDVSAQLACIEAGGQSPRTGATGKLRVTFWNTQQGHAPERQAGLLAQTGADVMLLCELDNGVARTGGRHVTRDMADRLAAGFLYAVEFIEMDSRASGEPGFHGNAIVSRLEMAKPMLVRLGDADRWKTGSTRRIGTRIALASRVMLDEAPVVLVATHLESHAGPEVRARQMRTLLDAVDAYAGGAPVLIGGDFNTRTAAKDDMRAPAARTNLRATDPRLLIRPAPREPLFALAEAAGYDWRMCNTDTPTERAAEPVDATPRFRLDWFFARGLICENPATVPATHTNGEVLSDHDAITLDVRCA